MRVAVVGRPNAGKSTLINALLGEERLIAFDQPGTTRDAVAIDFERAGKPYTLIDTAGLRRRGKVTDTVEKFSIIKTLQAIEDCNVCVLLIDAVEGVSDQDAAIASYILEAGRALVIAVNKWDWPTASARLGIKAELDRKLHFLRFARMHPSRRAEAAFVHRCADAFGRRGLRGRDQQAVDTEAHACAAGGGAPPGTAARGPFRPKMRYAHQGGQNPPIIVIHGSLLAKVRDATSAFSRGGFASSSVCSARRCGSNCAPAANPYAPRD